MVSCKGGTPKYRFQIYRIQKHRCRFYRITYIIEWKKGRKPILSISKNIENLNYRMAKKIYPERSDISRLKTDMKNVHVKCQWQCLNERNETKVGIFFEENFNESKQS